MPFAGLWETWDGPNGLVDTCTICTTEANDMMGQLHTRMPIILPHDSIDRWLDRTLEDPAELKALLRQYLGEEMVSWQVGNVRNEGPELIEPVGTPAVVKLDEPA